MSKRAEKLKIEIGEVITSLRPALFVSMLANKGGMTLGSELLQKILTATKKAANRLAEGFKEIGEEVVPGEIETILVGLGQAIDQAGLDMLEEEALKGQLFAFAVGVYKSIYAMILREAELANDPFAAENEAVVSKLGDQAQMEFQRMLTTYKEVGLTRSHLQGIFVQLNTRLAAVIKEETTKQIELLFVVRPAISLMRSMLVEVEGTGKASESLVAKAAKFLVPLFYQAGELIDVERASSMLRDMAKKAAETSLAQKAEQSISVTENTPAPDSVQALMNGIKRKALLSYIGVLLGSQSAEDKAVKEATQIVLRYLLDPTEERDSVSDKACASRLGLLVGKVFSCSASQKVDQPVAFELLS